MNEIKLFENPEFGNVRTITINDEPWFAGSDVAECLGYARPRDAARKLIKDTHKKHLSFKELSELQNGASNFGTINSQGMVFIDEAGLYRLIMRSTLPKAEEFQEWVEDEVLPTLRKKGGIVTDWSTYLDSMSAEEANFVAELFKENAKKKKEIELLKLENARKKEPWKERRYKGELYSLREASKILGLPQNEFISWLSENNFIFKNQWDRWEAYRQYVEGDRPLLKYIHTMRNGSPRSQTKVTEYGIDYFEEELNI